MPLESSSFIFFRTHDADMSQYFGLIHDLTLRPAYWAFKAATTYLYSENQIRRSVHEQWRTS